MSNIYLLFFFSLCLVATDIIWTASQYSFSDDPKVCACYCSDDSLTFPELTLKVKYKGLARTESLCTCEDFLAPKLHTYVQDNVNETCEICKCSVASDIFCKDGLPTFFAKYQTVVITVICVTVWLDLMNCISLRCSAGQRSQNRRSYERIIDYANVFEISSSNRNPAMSNLCLLFFFSLCLVATDIIWTASQYSFSDDPKVCACYCSDDSLSFPELSLKVKYKGLTRTESLCTCEDFLAPKLHRYVLANVNETCEICKCSVASDIFCKDGLPTFFAKYQTVVITVICVTVWLDLMNCISLRCSAGQRSQNRRSYERIIDYANVNEAPALFVKKIKFSKPLEKLYKANNELKPKFKLLEEKVFEISSSNRNPAMSNLCLLFFFSLCLVATDIIWTASQYSFSDDPKVCACYCSDDSLSFPELSSKVKYKGLTRTESLCTCEDFLAPKLHRYVLANVNETCEICKCSVVSDIFCKDGLPTFFAKYQTVVITVICVTAGLALMNFIAFRCSIGQTSQKRRGYERIIDYANVNEAPAFFVEKTKVSKPLEKLYKANNELKLKFKLLEEKVRHNKETDYSQI
ncbi:hypothetical protein HNY73_000892 [Argiope bruennichi]|uniref:Uncharacterized protein n=1 Tax=Argiope bruennichi TaxID=94029 RepID=A0A8T0FZK1_ARGBR|nr:hypothetical protein HNY73_000892 [Argiope bruennichi]